MTTYINTLTSIVVPLLISLHRIIKFREPTYLFAQFYKDLEEIWKPGIVSARRKDAIEWEKWNEADPESRPKTFEFTALDIDIIETDYIVVGPLTNDLDVATGEND